MEDFFFASLAETSDCQNLMKAFINVSKRLNVPIADEKTEGPTYIMEYLGLAINTRDMTIQIPEKKLKELLSQIKTCFFKKGNSETTSIIMWISCFL